MFVPAEQCCDDDIWPELGSMRFVHCWDAAAIKDDRFLACIEGIMSFR